MTPRRFAAGQFCVAFLVATSGIAVAVGILVREHRAVMARIAGRLNGHEVTS